MSHKIEINQDEKWIMTIALEEQSVAQLLKYAELLQRQDIEGHDIDDINFDINERLKQIS